MTDHTDRDNLIIERNRYQAAIKEALDTAPGYGQSDWRRVDRMISILTHALNEPGESDDR